VAGARSAIHSLAAATLVAVPVRAQVLSQTTVTSVGAANALSTPSARHLVRMDSGTYLLALQRDGAPPDTGLNLYRSDDDGRSWAFSASLNSSAAERHTADLVKVGDDVAIVTSFDAPSILPDVRLDPARKVYFQWWRGDHAGNWAPEGHVTVFNPTAGTAYHRGEVAVDANGRIWVQAFKRGSTFCDPVKNPKCAVCSNTEANGDNYGNEIVVAVSTDGGRTFGPERSLATTLCRAGGRLIRVGSKLLLLWNDYSANENGTRIVTRFVERDAADPISSWSAPSDAFPDDPPDGIYHGAAMSTVADATGFHLVYKDQNQLRLWYRRYDAATHTFGARVQIDDSTQDWALQPSTTVRKGDLHVFANHRLASGRYETRMWRLSTGLGAMHATSLQPEDGFHGYPTLPESVPASVQTMPYVYARAPTSSGAGDAIALRIALEQPSAVLSLEAGRALLPAGKSIAIRIQTTPQAAATDPVQLDVSGLPASVHAAFTLPRVLPGEAGLLTLAADPTAAAETRSCVLTLGAGGAQTAIAFRLDVVAAPVVALRGPTGGAVIAGVAHIDVTGAASPGMSLAELRLLVDGAPVATAVGSAASFTWDTTGVVDGAHDLSAMAVDEIGNSTTTDPVRVSIRNGVGKGGGCASGGISQPLIVLAAALAAMLPRTRRRESRRSST
jgi:hypothetical protein